MAPRAPLVAVLLELALALLAPPRPAPPSAARGAPLDDPDHLLPGRGGRPPWPDLFFNGVFVGLYRTNSTLAQQAGTDNVIPPAVRTAEGYNHIGDIDWSGRGRRRGRVLLPLECYYPGSPMAGTRAAREHRGRRPADAGVALLRQARPGAVPKAMWCAVSPNGAQAARGPRPARPAPAIGSRRSGARNASRPRSGRAARAARRVPRRRAPEHPGGALSSAPGAAGASRCGPSHPQHRRACADAEHVARAPEARDGERGRSEARTVRVLGGVPHWTITPFTTTGRPPTYGSGHNTLLSFVPRFRRGH